MPEHIRALIFILVLAALVFKFCEIPATAVAMNKSTFVSRRNNWFLIVLIGFLSQNIWVYYLATSFLLYRAAKKESNKVALFFFLILALPQLQAFVPGFAGISYFIEITFPRILVWMLLLPIFWEMFTRPKTVKFVWNIADIILLLYVGLNVILNLQYLIFTEWVRYVLGWMSDVIIPYFVISRSVKDMKSFREVVMSFIVGAMVISAVGILEFFKQWHIYQSLSDALDVNVASEYLIRGGNLRSFATTGQPIVLGYVIAIAIGFYGYIKKSIPNFNVYLAGLFLLIGGEIVPLSKGPWVGVVIAIVAAILLGQKAFSRLAKISIPVLILSVALMFTDYADGIISYLPFIGKLDEGSMDYRSLLIEKSVEVIKNNLFFGSNDYWLYLEDLRQGQGIIDIVNDYIGIALNCGLVGLAIYLFFFVSVFWRVYSQMKNAIPVSEEHELGQALIGTLIGIMIMLSSVSEIDRVGLIYWSIAALAIAYSNISFARDGKSIGK